MHKYSCQFVSKNVHIMVIITDYKSGALYLKEHLIEYISTKIKHCLIEFDIDRINEDTNHIMYISHIMTINITKSK